MDHLIDSGIDSDQKYSTLMNFEDDFVETGMQANDDAGDKVFIESKEIHKTTSRQSLTNRNHDLLKKNDFTTNRKKSYKLLNRQRLKVPTKVNHLSSDEQPLVNIDIDDSDSDDEEEHFNISTFSTRAGRDMKYQLQKDGYHFDAEVSDNEYDLDLIPPSARPRDLRERMACCDSLTSLCTIM